MMVTSPEIVDPIMEKKQQLFLMKTSSHEKEAVEQTVVSLLKRRQIGTSCPLHKEIMEKTQYSQQHYWLPALMGLLPSILSLMLADGEIWGEVLLLCFALFYLYHLIKGINSVYIYYNVSVEKIDIH
jgi:hypothetical protein